MVASTDPRTALTLVLQYNTPSHKALGVMPPRQASVGVWAMWRRLRATSGSLDKRLPSGPTHEQFVAASMGLMPLTLFGFFLDGLPLSAFFCGSSSALVNLNFNLFYELTVGT